MRKLFFSLILVLFGMTLAKAGEVDVLSVEVRKSGEQYRFAVTVEHGDEGWDHYADGWEVVDKDGTIYGKRVLAHPHVDEQPFTRAGTFEIPEGVNSVIIRAHDSVHGNGGIEMEVALPE